MQFIAIFGIAKKETIYAWQILHSNVDVFLLICASIFYIVAWFPAERSSNTTMRNAIEIDIALLWGLTALMQAHYVFFYPSWLKGMKLRTLGEWITNPLPQVDKVDEYNNRAGGGGDPELENVIIDIESTIV